MAVRLSDNIIPQNAPEAGKISFPTLDSFVQIYGIRRMKWFTSTERCRASMSALTELMKVFIKQGGKDQLSFSTSNPSGGARFSVKVERLNYALHGEVNRAILVTGDFLHLKPQGAAALAIAVGMEVKGVGSTKPMISGFRVIETQEVNGIKLDHKPKPKKKAHG